MYVVYIVAVPVSVTTYSIVVVGFPVDFVAVPVVVVVAVVAAVATVVIVSDITASCIEVLFLFSFR